MTDALGAAIEPIRTDLWACACTVSYGYAGDNRYGWTAKIRWTDGRWAEKGAVGGTITTRYWPQTLPEAIDLVVSLAKQFGITFRDPFFLQFEPQVGREIPHDVYQQLMDEAARRGWDPPEVTAPHG